MRRGNRFGRGTLAGLALAASATWPAAAQLPPQPSRGEILDLPLGISVEALPADTFADFACGTDGGPPSLPLRSPAEFGRCPPDGAGRFEVYLRYDDELEYWARALDEPVLVERLAGTKLLGYDVVLSLLIDPAGAIAGIRIVSDPRVESELRLKAHELANFLRSRFRIAAAECIDLPLDERETPIGRIAIKQRCEAERDGRRLVLETRFFRRPGQAALDPHTLQLTEGQFESLVRFELSAFGSAARGEARASPAPMAVVIGERERAFLAGASRSCPGCDLAGARLQRRHLEGADLRGTRLVGATMHGASLADADLTGADLTSANLNKADLRRAKLTGAIAVQAMLYEARLDAAELGRADLNGAMLGRARMTRARLAETQLIEADLHDVAAAEATLVRADLSGARLDGAQLGRARLDGATLFHTSLIETRLRDAALTGADLRGADFLDADLHGADLSHSNLSGARLLSATLTDANLDGVTFAGTVMPDGTLHGP